MTELATEMPRCFSISIQSEVAWREALRALTEPAIWIAPENSSSFSVSVVLPASGWEMMANVRRRRVSAAKGEADKEQTPGNGERPVTQTPYCAGWVGSRASSLLRARRENPGQLERRRDFELVVAAVLRRLVRPPAQEDGGMAEAVALHMVVFHFADALGPQRFPGQVLAAAPAALPAGHP